VILVHRLRGQPLHVNADLIESIEATPDTVLTLVDGRRILVEEPPETVVQRFTTYRASLLVAADSLREPEPDDGPQLSLVANPVTQLAPEREG
jgi:flagellar protein FlbD